MSIEKLLPDIIKYVLMPYFCKFCDGVGEELCAKCSDLSVRLFDITKEGWWHQVHTMSVVTYHGQLWLDTRQWYIDTPLARPFIVSRIPQYFSWLIRDMELAAYPHDFDVKYGKVSTPPI